MNKQEEATKKEDKKKKRSLIFSVIIALLGVLLFHLRLGTGYLDVQELMSGNGRWAWGYTALLVALFFLFFVIAFLFSKGIFKIKKEELTDEEKKNRKKSRVEFIFVFIDLLMTGMFVRLNWSQISTAGTLWAIAEIAAFFAIVWFGFEFFHKFRFFPERIFRFVIGFFVQVCIPMLFLLIIMLGAYQSKYGYDDLFREQIGINSEKFASVMQDAYYKLITAFYDIGQGNPDLWIWLPVAAFFVMTLWLLYRTFTKPEKRDEDKSAQEIIDESLREQLEEEQLEEEDYELGRKKRPMAYNFFKKIGNFLESEKDKKAKLKEIEEDRNMKYNIYSIKFTEMKGDDKR